MERDDQFRRLLLWRRDSGRDCRTRIGFLAQTIFVDSTHHTLVVRERAVELVYDPEPFALPMKGGG